ncbi:MAG: hypothetical protein WC829_18935 [Hyphomicrobium sp.]|jgi:hypothetical protein
MKTTLTTLALFAALTACGYALATPPLYPCSPYQTVCQKPPVCPPQTALMRWLATMMATTATALVPDGCPRY